uniref:SAM domain-containing protein n=1 Tax=Spongospora subterranea TaxID=70186 RepID=A0A0H5R8M8_9EUKA|eukprot:CRZ10478.1 hypothetical protein [Spongospora subterranea]
MDMASILGFEGFIPVSMGDFPSMAMVGPGARKEAMKVYMREYRRRQKYALNSLPDCEKERILDVQRQRVRDRVRRHRQRKKLRASGLEEDEVERRLRDMAPTLQQRRIKSEPLCQGQASLHQHLSSMSMTLDGIMGNFCPQSQSPSTSPDLSQMSFVSNLPNNIDFGMVMGMPVDVEMHEGDLDPRSWNSSQVGVFLLNLNLGQLEPIFQKHNIDGQMLLELTQDNIEAFVPDDARVPLLSAIDSLKQVVGG